MGLKRGQVKLEPHTRRWATQYLSEEKVLKACLNPTDFVAIQHVGSTAIKGISAKPIVDMVLGVKSLEDAKELVPQLESCGYEYKSEDTVPNRLFFAKGEDLNCTFYLHIAEVESDYYKDKLLFRDYLNKNLDKAKQYDNLKRKLAVKHAEDRSSYTEAKTDFITDTIKQIKLRSKL